jgi:anti-sigma factor RsiW
MSCDATLNLLDAYADAELGPAEAAALDAHFRVCATCREQHLTIRALKAAVRSNADYHRAPADLGAALAARLGRGEREPAAGPARRGWFAARLGDRERELTPRPPRRAWFGQAVAASAAAAFAAATITYQLAIPSAHEIITADAISSHARSLIAQQIVDVASSDQHTVKPWFNGRLDFTPPVRDTAAEGYPLVGGRIDYLNERQVAALVYKRRKHYIDVFVRPNEQGAREVRETARRGFTVLSWSDPSFDYLAVSDLDRRELREFAGYLGAPAPKR